MGSLGDGVKKVLLAGIGTAAVTAEKSKEVLDKMAERGEAAVEQGKVLNQELKHNAKKKVKEHVFVKVTKKYDNAFECVDEMSAEDLELLKERIAKAEALQKEKQEAESEESEEIEETEEPETTDLEEESIDSAEEAE